MDPFGPLNPWTPFGPTPTAVAQPTDLLNAIKLRFQADPLAAAVAGPYLEKAARTAAPTYVVMAETGAGTKLVTSTSQVHATRVRFKLYGGGAAAAGVLADRLENLYRDCRLSFQGGWSSRWVRTDRRHVKDEALSRPGNDVWYVLIEFTTTVKR